MPTPSLRLDQIAITAAAEGGSVYGIFAGADARYMIGTAQGLAYLGADGKIPAALLPVAVLGQVEYRGAWDASSGAAPTAVPEKGWYYIVTVDGNYNLSGIAEWKVGDWAIYNGVAWNKVDNTDAVSSVAGLVGVITVAALKGALGYTAAELSAEPVQIVEDYAGTARVLAAGDNRKLIRCTSAAAVAIEYPAGLPAHWRVDILQAGDGQVTVSAGAGATVDAADAKKKTRVKYSVIGVARDAADHGIVYGDRA